MTGPTKIYQKPPKTTEQHIQQLASRGLYFNDSGEERMNNIQPKTSWSQRLDELMATLPQNHHHEMGMPQSWQGFVNQAINNNKTTRPGGRK